MTSSALEPELRSKLCTERLRYHHSRRRDVSSRLFEAWVCNDAGVVAAEVGPVCDVKELADQAESVFVTKLEVLRSPQIELDERRTTKRIELTETPLSGRQGCGGRRRIRIGREVIDVPDWDNCRPCLRTCDPNTTC